METARALYFQSKVPVYYWGECVKTAAYLINRMPSRRLDYNSPYEILFKHKPDYSILKAFGCLCFVSTSKTDRSKLDPRAVSSIFLGYPASQKEQPDISSYDDIDVFQYSHSSDSTNDTSDENFDATVPPRRSSRVSHRPVHYSDYVCTNATTHSLPVTHWCNMVPYTSLPYVHKAFIAQTSQIIEPVSYQEAIQDPNWIHAMDLELKALEKNNTWDLVSLPKGKKMICCKWVFKVKLRSDSTIERYKARLVAKGFTQKYGIDFHETFSPVIKITTVRSIIALAASRGWKLFQLDVNNAFLHGDLHEEVYMKLPEGLVAPNLSLKDHLHKTFSIKDLGQLSFFLGIEVGYSADGITLTQGKFTREMLLDSGISSFKIVATPLPLSLKLIADMGLPVSDPSYYRCMLGKLNFLTNTRPDLAYTVQTLSQFMHSPCDPHLQALHHVLHYVHSTAGQGILLQGSSQLTLQAFSDSDWASCPNTRRSVTGYLVLLGNSPISWKSKKQSTVSRSSSEAEYRTMAAVASEITWLVRLPAELGITDLKPVKLRCDNQYALHIARNPVFHERIKHIEIDCHFTREKVLEGLIQLSYLPSNAQPADLLTKILPSPLFTDLKSKLGMISPITSLRGGGGTPNSPDQNYHSDEPEYPLKQGS
ncbi:hypothetical protein AgCh_030767 [Apium graveolens]